MILAILGVKNNSLRFGRNYISSTQFLLVLLGLLLIGHSRTFAVDASSNNGVAREEVQYWDAAKKIRKSLMQLDSQDRQHGFTRSWNERGVMLSEAVLEHGILVSVRGWYSNGVLKFDEHCRDGLSDGWQTWWDPNGSLLKRIYFSMGTGVEYYFDDSGKERFHIFWISGVEMSKVAAAPSN